MVAHAQKPPDVNLVLQAVHNMQPRTTKILAACTMQSARHPFNCGYVRAYTRDRPTYRTGHHSIERRRIAKTRRYTAA